MSSKESLRVRAQDHKDPNHLECLESSSASRQYGIFVLLIGITVDPMQ